MDSQKLLERTTYTASLVSNRQDIDQQLDVLNQVTSKDTPTKADAERIIAVQGQLEDYLVTKERMRYFTRNSLKLQIEQHLLGNSTKKSKLLLFAIITTSVIVAIISALIPMLESTQHRVQVAGATACGLITVGSGIMFINALSSFRSELRKAFVVICTAVTLLGLSLLEQPFIEIFELRNYPVVSIIYPIPLLLSAILFYLGIKKYVQIVGLNNFWTSLRPVVALAIVTSVVAILIPHHPTNEIEFVHDLVAIIWSVMIAMPIISAIMLKMAEKKLPDLYRNPVHHLFLAMIPIAAVIGVRLILRILEGPVLEGTAAYILFSLLIIMGTGLLWAGYSFNKVSRY